jgi:putative addiction module component (TIGR02574 family)
MEEPMGTPLEELEAEALGLSPQKRAELVQRLIRSLDQDVEDDPEEVERAWEDEIRRRVAELDAGTAELVPAEEVFAELRGRPRP